MNTFFFFVMLLLPGQPPMVDRTPTETYEACVEAVAQKQDAIVKWQGREYKAVVGCEVDSTKSNPA